MHGQNLSLQVHPLTEYIQQEFNMHYTQDESYYILDAEGGDSCVFLGVRTGAEPEAMISALDEAQNGGAPFPAGEFVNRIPVKKHDHLLIPAGTVHCSGANTMVLEISATPYIFTFKAVGLGAAGPGRQAAAHPPEARGGEYTVEQEHRVGEGQPCERRYGGLPGREGQR